MEAVAIDENGKPSFQLLQSTLKDQRGANLVFYAFDLLVDRGEDIRKLPNIVRKDRLASLLAGTSGPIVYGDHIVGRGEEMFQAVCKSGGEGIISKKASAIYSGTRSGNWLKIKCIQRQEFVIVGWSESDKRKGFRSLLLAAKEGGKLTYVGKVGTGFNAKSIQDLMTRMEPLAVDKAPVEVPRADRKGAHWIKPRLVAEIAFSEFTDDGILRHPSFMGLREDKPASQVKVEVPKHTESVTKQSKPKASKGKRAPPKASKGKTAKHAIAEDFGIEISSPDRVIFPELDLTKKDLADYYAKVWDWMEPHVTGRVLALVRCPDGASGQCFFQKHASAGIDAKRLRMVPEPDGDKSIAIDDLGGGHARMGTFTPLDCDFVKLDMSLVRDIDKHPMKQRLVRSVTELCKQQGIKLIGEGVETDAEAKVLVDLGCDYLQGYLIAKPQPPFADPL